MTQRELIQRLLGRTIVAIELHDNHAMDLPFDHSWLTGQTVEITLDDGTILDTLGEPLEVGDHSDKAGK